MFEWLFNGKKLRENGVLGMNDRNYSVIAKYNRRSLYTLVDDKVKTKRLANSININTPKMIGIIEHQYQVKNLLDIVKGYDTFVIKPAHGSGGKGVLVIKEYDAEHFYSASGDVLSFKDVYQHVSNTLSGLFSLGGKYDVALIEEAVNFSDVFKDFSYHGVPDVRVIVYKGFPAMVMMRLATKESGGRANLHQYRLHEEEFQCGMDVVVIARVNAKNCTYFEIEGALLHLGKLHHILKETEK